MSYKQLLAASDIETQFNSGIKSLIKVYLSKLTGTTKAIASIKAKSVRSYIKLCPGEFIKSVGPILIEHHSEIKSRNWAGMMEIDVVATLNARGIAYTNDIFETIDIVKKIISNSTPTELDAVGVMLEAMAVQCSNYIKLHKIINST